MVEGGTNQKKLNLDQLPTHKHDVETESDGEHSHSATSSEVHKHQYETYAHSIFPYTHTIGGVKLPAGQSPADDSGGAFWAPTRIGFAPQNTSIYHGEYTGMTMGEQYGDPHHHNVSKYGSDHKHTMLMTNAGAGEAFDNRPNYVTLYYIYRIE
jgi:hypothetical protein